jgi:hypothetical protein
MISLLPGKHVTFSESILGLGALILSKIGKGRTIDDIWVLLHQAKSPEVLIPEKIRFDEFLLSLDFLFMIGAVCQASSGEIQHATP